MSVSFIGNNILKKRVAIGNSFLLYECSKVRNSLHYKYDYLCIERGGKYKVA